MGVKWPKKGAKWGMVQNARHSGGTDREISASFEQEKSATEVGQPTPGG